MSIQKLIEIVRNLPNCIVYPSNGFPLVEDEYTLPEDVKEFYELCGGVALFEQSDYPSFIVSPEQFVLVNPIIIGERCEEDITGNWYTVGTDGKGEYISIDLHPERIGKCYDSFFDRHGVVGECPIIAQSFTDLLKRLLENRGSYWYWLKDDFESMGDAYDLVE